MSDTRSFAGMQFDPADGRLAPADGRAEAVSLRPQVARLLLAFLQAPNKVLSRENLAAAVWDDSRVVDFEAGLSALIRELRVALGEIGGDPAIIETVPRRGYRFHLDPDRAPGADQEPVQSAQEARAPAGVSGSRTRLAAMTLALVAAVVLGVWAWSSFFRDGDSATHASDRLRLAVLPFVHYRDSIVQPERELRAADAMLAALWQADLERVELIGRTSLIPYAGAVNVAERVAEDLSAALILEGSVSEGDESWRIDVRLLRLPGGSVIWSGTRVVEAGQTADVWLLAEELVAELALHWSTRTLDRAMRRK